MQSGANGWALKRVIQGWLHKMADENKKPIHIGINENSFELILRILGNEFIAIRIGSTNFSGKLIVYSILLLLFSFMLIEVFEVNTWIAS